VPVKRSTVQKGRRLFFVLGAAVPLLTALSAAAANLVDVRVGLHDEYTRVVLETDEKAPLQIVSSGSREMVLRLGASSGPRTFATAKSAHMMSLVVKPAAPGTSEIRIALRGPVDVKKLVLSAPHRVVLDLSAAKEAEAPPATAAKPPAPAPRAEPAAAKAVEPAKKPPVPAPEPESRTAPSRQPAPGEAVKPAAEVAKAEEKEEPGALRAAPEPDAGAMVAPKPARMPRRAAPPPPPAAEQGLLSALPAPLDQPLVLAGIALVLIVVIALVMLRRRGGAEAEEPITPFAAGEPFSVDERPDVAAEPQTDAQAEEPAPDVAGAPAGPSTEGSLFDQPVEMAEPLEEPQVEPEAPEEVPVTPAAAEPAAAAESAPELERRLARLEERLEEVVDGNDRLGRQVAAQTEELRVQRAAIARTQRVLRDLTRTDEATEPVPKT
jgi:hypothetical protein